MSNQVNFNNEKLDMEQSFTLVYSGPTFKSGIKINKFIENLESLQELVYTIADVNSEYQSGYNKKDDIKQIKIIPKSGCFLRIQLGLRKWYIIKGTMDTPIVPSIMKASNATVPVDETEVWLGGINDTTNTKAIAAIPHPAVIHIPSFPPGIVNGLLTSGWE